MEFEILFLDIDGTILRPDHTYEQSTLEAIRHVHEKGLKVFIATGRPLHEIRELAKELGIEAFIAFNGAYALMNEEVLFYKPFDRETIERYVNLTEAKGHDLVLYTDGFNCYTSLEAPRVRNFMEVLQMTKNRLIDVPALSDTLGATLLGVEADRAHEYNIDAAIHLSQVNVEGAKDCYDLIRKTVNKGVAVKAILNRLGIPKEKAIAFGDGMNDKEMLQETGHSFAMGNANPELFQFAKYQTSSVENSGIYNGLKQLGLLS